MAYTKNMWHAGDPITQALMNNIEDGIEEALNKATNAQSSADTEANTNNTQNALLTNLTAELGETNNQISEINQKIGEGFDETSTIANRFDSIDDAMIDLNTSVNQNSANGTRAWSQLIGAGVLYNSEDDVITTSLSKALDDKYAKLQDIINAYETPNSADTVIIDGQPAEVKSLARRIRHIYNAITDTNTIIDHVKADNNDNTPNGLKQRIETNERNIASLQDSVIGTSGQGVKTRLDALDGGNIQVQADLPTRNIKSIITEIANAQVSDVYLNNSDEPTNYGTLEQRFKADELKIKGAETEISDAHRVGLRDANDEPIDDTLDKRFDDIDGGSKPTRTLPSIISEIETARNGAASLHARINAIDNTQDANSVIKRVETLENTMPDKINYTDIYSGLNIQEGVTGKVLDAQYGRILNERITTVDNAIDARLDVLEAARPTTTDDQTGETIYGTLDDRFDAIEGRATQLETDVSAIETEINNAHVNNGTLDDRFDAVEGRATQLETDVSTIGGEIEGAHRDSNDTLDARFDDIESDITDISNAIDHVHGENDELPNGLKQRITAIENSLTEQGGINDRLDAIDDASTGAIKALQDADYALDQRLDALDTAETGAIAQLQATDTALSGRLNAIDGGSALDTTNGTLSARVAAAETKISHTKDENDENDKGGLEQRMDAAETALTTKVETSTMTTAIETAVALKANASDLSALQNTVNGISTTIVLPKTSVTYTNEGEPSENQSWSILDKNDYLLQSATDDKYYYWKHITVSGVGAWHLMGGAGSGGGTGNTSGFDLSRAEYTALASTTGYAENTDYYVTENDGLVRHYRYVEINDILTEIEIGPLASNIKRYNISSGVETTKVDGVDTDVTYLYLHEFDYGEDNDEPDANTIITRIPLPAGGGAAISSQKMVRITERSITQPLGAVTPVELKFFYTSGVAKESGVGQLYINDVATGDEFSVTSGDPKDASSTWPTVTQENPLPDGFYSIDVSQYCTELGTKQFRIKISDPDDETGTMWKDLKWDVNVMNLTITSTFTEHSVNTLNSTVKFIYTANGNIDKVANFKLGNTVLPSVNLSSNTSGVPQEYNISMPQAGAGAYRLEVWLTASANGHALPPSQSIYRDIIWYDPTSSDVIISSPYRDNIEEPVTQYDTIEIPYTIVGGTTPYTVYYYVDDMSEPINQVTLTGNSGVWEYRADQKDDHTLKIECQSASITFTIDVAQLDIDIAPETINLILDFNPQGITNTSNKRLWTNGTYHMTVSDNFDWYNGGYGSDDSGDYFLIKAGTRAIFDYKMFVSEDNDGSFVNEVFQNGKELKIIFKTAAVRNADAIWFTNMGPSSSSANAKQVGIQLSAHNGFLKTDSASNVAVGGVAATNTYLYFPYSEEDKIELDININKLSENNNFIMSYEDGCPSKAYPYKTSEILYHIEGQEKDITIGSDDCDVYIYRIRVYDSELNTEQVLRNFIADGKDSSESISRYNRNAIYYDTNKKVFTPYTNNNTILDPERLATKIPDVKVLMLETPRFTTNKKDFVPYSSLRCIHAPGGKYFKSRGKEDNWLFQNGYHAGQGTTSDKYGNAGRNLDFLFMCDGVHNPSDKVSVKKENFLPGYQSSLILGYGTEEQEPPTYCLDWKDEDTWKSNKEYEVNDLVRYNGEVYKCTAGHTSTAEFDAASWAIQEGYTSKVTLTSTSIPNNFFNLKVNIASSENANNALLQKRYNDFLLYSSPAHERDSRIKNDMEFVPAVIFVRETGIMDPDGAATAAERQEFNDDQWHFYALGNIGDSKKTDYTRAYDPQDMNEFTLEISDNNTNNSQFQSGVYMANYYRLVDNPVIDDIGDYYVVDGIHNTVEYNNETQYYGNFIKTLDTEIDNEHTYYTFIEQRRAIEPYTLEQDMDDGEPVEGSFTARSAAGQSIQTTEYLFPLLPGEWNDSNMRYWSLFNEGFDGDHSFEMRYACKGDYRDGKVVNDTTGQAKAQLKLNEKVWRAFYTWLVTSDNPTFVNELDQWVVRSSVEYYYAFTHYYTMMDNRAKNTFWHFAKTGKHRRVTSPVAALLHIYEEADGTVTPSANDANVYEGAFIKTSDVEIDNQKQYYTQYAFDMWVYDTDTALGIDNNGELVFPYGKEDKDYRIEGDASSSMVFNGAGSIFWCRLRDNCIDDIRGVFTSVQTECFNANTLINEFDRWQECYPEAIWRLDVERKYIRSFTGDTGPNGVYLTRKETRFLRDMMQGRKKYQRRQWVKDQDIYFGSKYMLPSVRDDFFEFSCYQPAGQAVTPNWDLTITPYQDMYINISYAETFASPFRAKAGVTYEFKSIFDQMNDSRIRVFGANHIQGLAGKAKREDPNDPEKITGAEGLASFYIKANNFEHGKKLRKLILGTDNTSYQNGNFTTLNIANDYPILEEFNIKNCGNLGGPLDLSKSTALKIIEAQGTQITQVLLPSSTGIETLHLPETITKIELRSAKQLDDITIKDRAGTTNVTHLTQLDVNDSDYSNNINWVTFAKAALNHLDLLSLLGLRISSITNIDELEDFKVRKSAINRVYLGGNLTVTGAWSTIEKTTYENLWQDYNLNLVVDENNEVVRYKVTYYKSVADMNAGNELRSVYLTPAPGSSTVSLGSDPVYTNVIPQPTKDPTVSTEYIFGERNSYGYMAWTGWRKSTSANPIRNDTNINTDTNLIAVFNERTRTYPIHWYLRENDNNPVYISDDEVAYGGSYNGVAPTVYTLKSNNQNTTSIRITGSNCTYSIFNGWQRLPINLDETYLNSTQTAFCIYGSWIGETNVPVSTILADEQLTPRKLLLLSVYNDNLDLGADLVEVNDTLDLTLGYDSKESGTLLIGEDTHYIMNDSRTYDPTVTFSQVNNPPAFASNIAPFSSDDGFTLAIDYRFDTSAIANNWSSGFSVLAGCHEKVGNVAQGFSLYYDIAEETPKFCFGNQSVLQTFNTSTYSCAVGDYTNADMRNIIVIRHPAGADYLQIYSGVYPSSNILTSLDDAFFVREIQWSSNSSAAKLCFGNAVPDGTSSPLAQMRAGLGTIYWAKYWNKDLGQSECTQLASWVHEKIRFAVEEYPGAEKKVLNTGSKNIIFTALQLSQYGGPAFRANSRGYTIGEIQSWYGSLYRDIANKRFFLGLPTVYQSIVNKTEGKASYVVCEQGQYNGKYTYAGDYDVEDYAFIPSYPEVTGSTGGYYEGEALREMPWRKAGNTKVISYVNTSFNTQNPTTNVVYMNLRFPGVPINLGENANVVYVNYTGTDSVYNKIGSSKIQRGDIFIYQGTAYIYANDEDVRNGAPIINSSSGVFTCTEGGWVASKPWWTRSVLEMDPANNTNSFYYINNSNGELSGGLPTDTTPTESSRNGCWFVYSFGI